MSPEWDVQVSGTGWFRLAADTEDAAVEAASEATRAGAVPLDVEWDYCEVESLELVEGDDNA